jgi:hypothetical protein
VHQFGSEYEQAKQFQSNYHNRFHQPHFCRVPLQWQYLYFTINNTSFLCVTKLTLSFSRALTASYISLLEMRAKSLSIFQTNFIFNEQRRKHYSIKCTSLSSSKREVFSHSGLFKHTVLLPWLRMWDLKGNILKVKLWKGFSWYKQHSLVKPDSYDLLLPQTKKSVVSYCINWPIMARPICPPTDSYTFFPVLSCGANTVLWVLWLGYGLHNRRVALACSWPITTI